jgi:peptidoglycan/LPS O-acetylase OafA/YrhL
MAKNSDGIIILRKRRKANRTFLMFLGILGFIAIVVPFFGSNLRYMTGTFFKTIFVSVGQIFLTIGGALFVINILKIFFRQFRVKSFLASALLLWIGAFLTGVPFEFLGLVFGGGQPPQGYHFY